MVSVDVKRHVYLVYVRLEVILAHNSEHSQRCAVAPLFRLQMIRIIKMLVVAMPTQPPIRAQTMECIHSKEAANAAVFFVSDEGSKPWTTTLIRAQTMECIHSKEAVHAAVFFVSDGGSKHWTSTSTLNTF